MISSKTKIITGWVLTGLITLMMLLSAILKLTADAEALHLAAVFGFSASSYKLIGLIEVFSILLFIIPRTGILGALLLSAYLGGAIATHWQHQESPIVAVILQCLIWITATIRFPELTERIMAERNITKPTV